MHTQRTTFSQCQLVFLASVRALFKFVTSHTGGGVLKSDLSQVKPIKTYVHYKLGCTLQVGSGFNLSLNLVSTQRRRGAYRAVKQKSDPNIIKFVAD